MHKLLFLVLCIIIFNGIDATGAGISDEDIDEILGLEGWKDSEFPYQQIPEDSSGEIKKRSNSNVLIRRSSLDKNFMRFGRSSFFPNNRCCKHKDMVGFLSSPNTAAITQERGPSEFRQVSSRGEDNAIRFGRPSSHGYIRFGRGDKDNFMRFGRGDKDNFMRFGRGDKDNFMRFGRGDKDNFMRFGRGDKDNFMRFGRGDKDNFMRFGRGDKDNFMRFGRGDKDNFMRFGRDDSFMRFGKKDKENFIRFGRDNENFIRFGRGDAEEAYSDLDFIGLGKSNSDLIRHGNQDEKDEKFIPFGRNGTSFSRLGSEDSDKEERLDSKNVLLLRRKRTVSNEKTGNKNIQTVGNLAERSALIEENISKPNLLKFISMINSNRPVDSMNQEHGPLSLVLRYPDAEKYKRRQDKSAFIRFG